MEKPPRWEYKLLAAPFSKGWSNPSLDANELERSLNHLGSEGWELVSVITTNLENGRSGDAMAVLKRPLPGRAPQLPVTGS